MMSYERLKLEEYKLVLLQILNDFLIDLFPDEVVKPQVEADHFSQILFSEIINLLVIN